MYLDGCKDKSVAIERTASSDFAKSSPNIMLSSVLLYEKDKAVNNLFHPEDLESHTLPP